MTDPEYEYTDAEVQPVEAEAAEPFPWPPADGESVVQAWGSTWQGASLRPARFFAAMPRTTSLGAAIAYYLSIGIAVAGATLFWSMVRGGPEAPASALPGIGGAWSPVLDFLFSPLLLLFILFVAAGFTHLMLLILAGAAGGFGTTLRVFCFAYSPQILGVIPVIGALAGFVWMVWVAIVGLREAHGTSTARSAAAVLIPVAIGTFFVILGALIAAAGFLEMPT